MARILVADDDPHIREVVEYALARDGHEVTLAVGGLAALSLAQDPARAFELLVLDIMMPDLDGLEVCRRLRATSELPIIFLTSRGDEVDRIVGLELGADDYLAKPFSPRELVARARAILRRGARQAPAPASLLRHGPIALDPAAHEVTCHGELVPLTATEFALLEALLRRPGQVLTREVLVGEVYRYDHHITERTIDTHVRRIRSKFRRAGHEPIETVHGVGYKARKPATTP